MKLESIEVFNFRLLKEVKLSLEEITTVIVGRNNSGKTSLTEIFYKLLTEKSKLSLEDFTLSRCDDFWSAYKSRLSGGDEATIRSKLPEIKVVLNFSYDKAATDLGKMSDFIVDLDEKSNKTKIEITYSAKDGQIKTLLSDPVKSFKNDGEKRVAFLKELKDRIKTHYSTFVEAVDPADPTNRRNLGLVDLKALLSVDFINAQRPLDSDKTRESNTLSKLLEPILSAKSAEQASDADKGVVNELNNAVSGVQSNIDKEFKDALESLLPSLKEFGYPGLNDSILKTETILDVEKLLREHTTLFYEGIDGVNLPESQNGLGTRNLIYILFRLYQAFKSYQSTPTAPSLHLIFIEEPEAHLHPQMQEVFIKQINEIKKLFTKQYNDSKDWPVQFIVTTHSSHVANQADFRAIRYFLTTRNGESKTDIKDLRIGLKKSNLKDGEKFLHKYLELTRCDLFFADKAILIEGQTERILLPKIIKENSSGLRTQYISIVEVGGAYAHIFFDFLNFLEIKTLIITDIDTTVEPGGVKCKVEVGKSTSNACIKEWFSRPGVKVKQLSGTDLIKKSANDKVIGLIRIAYQIPETGTDAKNCGRSFEESFIKANPKLFPKVNAWDKANEIASNNQKTDFALNYAITDDSWNTPKYITEGLNWLACSPIMTKVTVKKKGK